MLKNYIRRLQGLYPPCRPRIWPSCIISDVQRQLLYVLGAYGDYIIIFIVTLYCRVTARDRWRYVAAEQWQRVTVTEYSGHSVTTRPTRVISLFFFVIYR